MNIVIKESGFHNALFRRVGFSFASFWIKFLYCISGMMCSISNCIMQMSSWGFSLLGVNASLSNFPAYANKQKPSNLGLQYRFMREVGRGGIDEVGWVGVMFRTLNQAFGQGCEDYPQKKFYGHRDLRADRSSKTAGY